MDIFLGTSLKLIVYIPWWKHSPGSSLEKISTNLYIKVFGLKASFSWKGATYFMLRNGFYDYGSNMALAIWDKVIFFYILNRPEVLRRILHQSLLQVCSHPYVAPDEEELVLSPGLLAFTNFIVKDAQNVWVSFLPLSDISFRFLPQKSGFVEDFSDILTDNKFNKKFGAITPTPYLNSLIPNYQITLINTLLKNKSAAKVSGTDL